MKDKPSLSALKKAHPKPRHAKPKGHKSLEVPLPQEVRSVWIQKFCTQLLDSLDPTAAYRAIRTANATPIVKRGAMGAMGALIHRLLEHPDVDAEMHRQIEALKKYANIDEEWIYRKWKAMGESNIFDYLSLNTDGSLHEVKLDPANLTYEQQQCVRELKFDPKTGKLTGLKLVSLEGTVENIARRVFRDPQEKAAEVDRVAELTRMTQEARKRIRVWDHESQEPIA